MPTWVARVRMALGFIGVAAGVAGIARDDRGIVTAGIVCLTLSFALRIAARKKPAR